MKTFIKTVIASSFVLASTQSFATTETLRVAVMFDGATTNFSATEKYKIATDQVKYLNKTMENSSLDNHIKYQLVTYGNRTFSSTNETYDILSDKYFKAAIINSVTKTPSLPLNHVSKNYQADIVIGIVKPTDYLKKCGRAPNIPTQGAKGDGIINDVIEFADTGIVFLTGTTSCLNDPITASHEVGHSFGLWHGQAVWLKTLKPGHYSATDAIDTEANGYGKTGSTQYGTVMTGHYLGVNAPDNKYSDKYRSDCGPYYNVCGDNNSSAVHVIQRFKTHYNKRGNWYN